MSLLPPVIAVIEGDISNFQSKMQIAKGELDAVDKKGEAVSGRFKTGLATGLLGAGIAFSGAGAALIGASDKIDKAEATLKQVIENTGNSWDAYKGKVEGAISSETRFGHGSADTQEALAKLTAGFQSPTKALAEMSLVTDIAAYKHISLADAAGIVVRMHAGAARTFKEFGINVHDNTVLINEAAKTAKAHETAVASLEKAQRSLGDLEARDAGVKKLSISQQQALAHAHEAVALATTKVGETAAAAADAQQKAQGATKNYDALMQQLQGRLHGVAAAQADTFGGKLDAVRANVENFAGSIGKGLGPVLAGLGPTLMAVSALLQINFVGFARATAGVIAHTVSSLADIGVMVLWKAAGLAGAIATGVMTAAQWALNVALDANPIGLVVLAIAALIAGVILAYQHVDWFRNAVNFLWKEVQILWGWVANNLLPVLGAVAGVVGGAVVGAFSSFAGAIGGVLGALGGLWNALSNAAGTALRLAGDIGNNIVNGIKNGINSAIGALGAALHALAMLLPDIVKNALGIHSPSSVFADQVGKPIVDGIAAGIARSSAAVDALKAHARQLAAVGADVTVGVMGRAGMPMLSSLAGGGAGGVHISGGVTINIQGANKDPDQIAREVRESLLRLKRSTGALGLA